MGGVVTVVSGTLEVCSRSVPQEVAKINAVGPLNHVLMMKASKMTFIVTNYTLMCLCVYTLMEKTSV